MNNEYKFYDYSHALDAKISELERDINERIEKHNSNLDEEARKKRWDYKTKKKMQDHQNKRETEQLKELRNLDKILWNFKNRVPLDSIDITEQKSAIETVQKTFKETKLESNDIKKVADTFKHEVRDIEKQKRKEAEEYGKELHKIANNIFCSGWNIRVHFFNGTDSYISFKHVIDSIVSLGYDKLGLDYEREIIEPERENDNYQKMLEDLDAYQKMINSGEVSELSFKTPKSFNPSKAIVKSREVIEKLSAADRRLKSINKAISSLNDSEKVKFPETIKLLESIKSKEKVKITKLEKEREKSGLDTIEKSVEEKKTKEDKQRDIKNAASILAKMQDLDPNSEEYREYQEMLREYHLSESEFKQAEYEGNKQNYIRNEVFRSLKMDGTIPTDKEIKDLNLNEKNILDIRTREAIQMSTEGIVLGDTKLNNMQPFETADQGRVVDNTQGQNITNNDASDYSLVGDNSEERKNYLKYRAIAIADGEEPMSYKGYQAYQQQKSEERFLR